MPLIIPVRASNAYIGIGKQSVSGTAVAPTIYPLWMDGTMMEITMKEEKIREGDNSRRLSQVIKNQQHTKVKIVCLPRPVQAGFFETAACGISADTVTPAVYTSTVPGSLTAGAATITVASVTNLPAPPTSLVINANTANEEVVPIISNVSTVLTILTTYNNGNGLKKSQTAGATIGSPTLHTITDQTDGNYYTIDVGLGASSGGPGTTFRVRDCKVDVIKRHSSAGKILQMEIDFIGISSVITTVDTPTYEARQPYYYTTGVWTLDGSLTGDAPYIEKFDITQKNALDTGVQSESIFLDATIFGQVDVDLTFDPVFQSPSRIYLTYYGAANGTTDAQQIGTGSFLVKFTQIDGFHTLQYSCTTLHYTKATLPVPKVDGKHFTLPVAASSVSNGGQNTNIISVVVGNTQTAAY